VGRRRKGVRGVGFKDERRRGVAAPTAVADDSGGDVSVSRMRVQYEASRHAATVTNTDLVHTAAAAAAAATNYFDDAATAAPHAVHAPTRHQIHAGCGGHVHPASSPASPHVVRHGVCAMCGRVVLECPFCQLFFLHSGEPSLGVHVQMSHTTPTPRDAAVPPPPPLSLFIHHRCGGVIVDVQVRVRRGAWVVVT